jgi:hypothetical protein
VTTKNGARSENGTHGRAPGTAAGFGGKVPSHNNRSKTTMQSLRDYRNRGIAIYAGARPVRRTVLTPICRTRRGNAPDAAAATEAILAGKRQIQVRLRDELGLSKR